MPLLSLRFFHPPPPPSPSQRRRFNLRCRLSPSFRRPTPLLSAAALPPSITENREEECENGRLPGRGVDPVEAGILPEGLRKDSLPKHVAMIMDANRRWARLRGLSAESGYEAGISKLRQMVELCCRWEIRVLTVFAFSTDNWFRPKVEVEFLMSLFERWVKEDMDSFERETIKISVIGNESKLPTSLQELMVYAEENTRKNTRFQLIVAVSYSGQYDIVQACQRISLKVKDGLLEPCHITESLIERELETNCTEFPHPDLLIQTSGELRVSNFLLWQLAYTELYFAKSLWPDFGEAEFVEALQSYQQRQRRYGGRGL